jgi:NADH-quinone oxidoreductase subunit C
MQLTEERLSLIKSKLSNFNITYGDVNGTLSLVIPKEQLLDACKILRDECGFDWLVDAVSVDRFTKQSRFEIIYNLRSRVHRDRIFFRAILESKNPESPSLTGIWESANWYEREAYDMMGIKFTNHPDPRRMYMPDEFEYYPLRKDFPLMGIPDSIPLPNK